MQRALHVFLLFWVPENLRDPGLGSKVLGSRPQAKPEAPTPPAFAPGVFSSPFCGLPVMMKIFLKMSNIDTLGQVAHFELNWEQILFWPCTIRLM